MNIRNTLCYLGVPFREKYFMFGDNEYIVNSASTSCTKLHIRHITLSFYKVRKAITAGVVAFMFSAGKENPVDILSSIGVTNMYEKYYNPYSFGMVILWSLYLHTINQRIRIAQTLLTLTSISMGSDKMYTHILKVDIYGQ